MASTFNADLKKFAEKLGKTLDQTHRGVVIKLFSAVIKDTPVLNGDLRGNWLISTSTPDLRVIDNKDKTGNERLGAVARHPMKAGDKTFLANSQPYAMRIEYEGWSSVKAPEGMVRKNVARIERIITEAVTEARS